MYIYIYTPIILHLYMHIILYMYNLYFYIVHIVYNIYNISIHTHSKNVDVVLPHGMQTTRHRAPQRSRADLKSQCRTEAATEGQETENLKVKE